MIIRSTSNVRLYFLNNKKNYAVPSKKQKEKKMNEDFFFCWEKKILLIFKKDEEFWAWRDLSTFKFSLHGNQNENKRIIDYSA